jgi:hypothetical protein
VKRRDFVKGTLVAGTALIVGPTNLQASEFVSASDPTAIALKYVENAEDADRNDKMGVPGSEQICANCRFYGDVNADSAGCTLFANKLVPAKAWCAGWVPIG